MQVLEGLDNQFGTMDSLLEQENQKQKIDRLTKENILIKPIPQTLFIATFPFVIFDLLYFIYVFYAIYFIVI